MFCGLATKVAHSLAPKLRVRRVPPREPEAEVHMHPEVVGRRVYPKATLGLMAFAGSCTGLVRVARDNASVSERATTTPRCGTPLCGSFIEPVSIPAEL